MHLCYMLHIHKSAIILCSYISSIAIMQLSILAFLNSVIIHIDLLIGFCSKLKLSTPFTMVESFTVVTDESP